MSEILRPSPHALVARFIYGDRAQKRVIQTGQYHLFPGTGVVFIGEEDMWGEMRPFAQPELENTLRRIPPGELQVLALLDQTSGSLLISRGPRDQSYGIGIDIPKNGRFMGLSFGRLRFAGIWGESEQEVQETLQKLQLARVKLN